MSEETIIKVAEELAPVVSSRDAVVVLKDRAEQQQSTKITLDFSDVQFISRSAAHELLMWKERLANQVQKREIYFINTSESVAKMLRVVAANRAVPKETTPADDIKTVAIDELTRQRPSVLGFFRRLFAH